LGGLIVCSLGGSAFLAQARESCFNRKLRNSDAARSADRAKCPMFHPPL
jgi:hypothetical protein